MERKWIHLLFAALAGVLIFLFGQLLTWGGELAKDLWAWPSPNELVKYGIATLLSVGIAFSLWRSPRVFLFVSECVSELEKVTWPTAKDTRVATLVVIVAVVVASALLGLFDTLLKALVKYVYIGSKTS